MSLYYRLKRYVGGRKKGSALIITLGILSLLLIVCMVFAFDTMSSNQAAKNYAISVQARLLNESGVKRAASSMDLFRGGNLDANHAFLNPSTQFYPDPGTGAWAGCKYLPLVTSSNAITSDTVEAFNAVMSDASGNAFEYTPSTGLPGVGPTATWDSVLVEGTTSDTVVGVMTYLIIDQTGKLDPGCVGNSASAITRTGKSLAEVNLFDALGNVYRPSYSTDSWFSLVDFAMAVDSTSLQADKLKIKSTLFPGTVPTPEEFWFPDWDGASDSTFVEAELFSRYDITQLTVPAIVRPVAEKLYSHLLLSDSSRYADIDSSTGSSKSLWLLKSKLAKLSTGDATEDAKTARRYAAQMVVNMLDYVDAGKVGHFAVISDGGKITKIDGLTATNFKPTMLSLDDAESCVFGVEDVCGLNDFMVKTQTNWTGTNVDFNFIFDIRLRNPLATPIANPTVTLKLKYEIEIDGTTYTHDDGGDPANPGPTPLSYILFTIPTVDPAITTTPSDFWVKRLTHSRSFAHAATPPDFNYELKSLEITELIIGNGSMGYYRMYPVCALGLDSADTFLVCNWGGTISSAAGGVQTRVMNLHAEDAHFSNIDPADATIDAARVTEIWTPINGNLATGVMENPGVAPTPYAGIGTSPLYSNSEYGGAECKDGTFDRVGELGRLHSPHTPNKSVRFWIKDSTTDTWQDAYLLDMFTTSPDPSRKININTSSPDVLKALFANVTGLTAVEAVDAQENIHRLNGTLAGMPFLYRGDIYKIFDEKIATAPAITLDSLGFANTEDAGAEQVITEVIELLGTRQNYFTVITTGRAIKDIGSADLTSFNDRCMQLSSGGTNRYGLTLGSYKTITAIYRDAWKSQAASVEDRDTRILRVSPLED